MTENEAIKKLERHIQFLRENWKPHPDYNVIESLQIAIQAIEEIQQFQFLGTVEEILNTFNTQQLKIASQHHELEAYRAIGNIEELQELKENQRNCKDCAGCTTWKCDCANIRAMAIDEFLHKAEVKITEMILSHQGQIDFASGLAVANRMLDEVAEEMRGEKDA